MVDLLSFITDIIGKRNQTSEAAANRAFSAAEAEKGRQFSGTEAEKARAAQLNEFNTQAQMAREKFVQDVKQQALDYGLNQRQVDERIRQFDTELANTQAQQLQAQQNYGGEFGLKQRELTNQENQQALSNLGTLSQLVGQGTTNMGQADILSLLAARMGNPMSALQFMRTPTATAQGTAPGMRGTNGSYNFITNLNQLPTTQHSFDGGAIWKPGRGF